MRILAKRNSSPGVIPHINELDLGEIAINTSDGKLFTKVNDGNIRVKEIGEDAVTSVPNIGDQEERVSRIVKMTQVAYDAITPDPDTLYVIVG